MYAVLSTDKFRDLRSLKRSISETVGERYSYSGVLSQNLIVDIEPRDHR